MSVLSTVRFDIDVLARSSIVHREDYTEAGTDTFALFRREKIVAPDGTDLLIPIVSGSSFRGVLRRIGEELTAAVLNYEGTLPIPAAHLLTNGGRLGKSANPLTDEQERHLKDLIPQIAVFGGSASGRIMSGLTIVGKVLPEIDELTHLLPRPPRGPTRPAALLVDNEFYAHLSDHRPDLGQRRRADTTTGTKKTSPLGRFEVETLPAGTRLQTHVRITDATDHQLGFLAQVLTVFAERGHIGGRSAAGHGQIHATIAIKIDRGPQRNLTELNEIDWATPLSQRRDQAIDALRALT
ncbi:RAMP superfamily CRISPR-associated protein [Mycobacteroides abscessus]|uniref:RAMP superfamily CRISPR-associated protein n=1 Tax=Mycobacteroides abscessus TaxID=36809 RepID=UPI00092CAD30|nr:RAMP superfamily CRISPR-associated protein [Mycobacteroides abscessus]MBL3752267.1 hypothetical protein [Mycobacteroides abscessus subsp. massiliense]QCO29016.1 hypothetical protein CFE69_24040 [Mycobacteroides abscessus subsp. massiliense]SHY29607.1 CRISPR type AFERR-associated protein Csf2 [Mycobacteroides abscessus subsp. abscessus]SID70728.1 CRISPR type AFERR-associated protein Csf2 [Mycobacteroides abscessus subsp. abscessus]SIK25443.1 CRISPR type AFERR-associated protein Csf2 [Mycobac